MSTRNKAALYRRNENSALARARAKHIVTDWERGCLWAGIAFGAAIALIGIIGGQLGW